MTLARFFKLTLLANLTLVIAILIFVASIINDLEKMTEAGNERFYTYKVSQLLRQSGEDLASFALAYMTTGEEYYRAKFNETLDIRNGIEPNSEISAETVFRVFDDEDNLARYAGQFDKLPLYEIASSLRLSPAERGKLSAAEEQVRKLVNIERRDFEVMVELEAGDSASRNDATLSGVELAKRRLFDGEYRLFETSILGPIEEMLGMVEQRTTSTYNSRAQRGRLHGILVGALALALLFLTVLMWRKALARVGTPFVDLQQRTQELGLEMEKLARTAEDIVHGGSGTEMQTVKSSPAHSTRVDEVEDLNRIFDQMIADFHSTSAAVTGIIGKQQARAEQLDRINADLKATRSKLSAILESLGEGVIGFDNEGTIIFQNNASLQEFGWGPGADMVGLNGHATYHHSYADGSPYPVARCPMYHTVTDGKLRTVSEEVFWRKDGTQFPIEYTVTPIRNANGDIDGAVMVFRDITERRAFEEKKQKLYAELEQRVQQRTEALDVANKELEAFSYSVSHDLRSPLRGIDSFIRILIEDYGPQLDAEGKRFLGIISDEARRMSRLIDDLLSFSRLGRQGLTKQDCEMTEIVRSTYESLDASTFNAVPEFKLSSLPRAHCDDGLMRQVWFNLLSNATKFSRYKSAPVIEVGGSTADGINTYHVKDNGAGFDARYKEKLFTVFDRLHSDREFEGTGIGLALVHQIIKRHGGEVWADGAPDQGATFYFTLPAAGGEHD